MTTSTERDFESPAPPSRALSWLVIAVASAGIILGNVWLSAGPDGPAGQDDTTRWILLRLQGKVLVGATTVQPEAAREQLAALDEEATTPRLARALAALHAEIDDRSDGPSRAALDLLDRHRDGMDDPSEHALHALAERAIRDPDGLEDGERELLRDRMGWFGDVLVAHASPPDDPLRRTLLGRSFVSLALVVALFVAAMGGVLAGAALLAVAVVRRRAGQLRTAFRPPGPEGAWYLQAFALYVLMFLVLQMVPAFVGPEIGGALAFVGLVVASAVGVAWPVVRGVPIRRAARDLGLTRGRGVVREIAGGIVGYVGILPIVAGGFVTTLILIAVWETIRPDGAPPGPVSHPIVPMMAEGGTAVRIGVLLLASGFAPLFEEIMFRGALYADVRRSLRPWVAAILVALVFAAIHPQGLLTVPALGSLAFGFAMIREWRGSLLAPMTAHALHNGILVGIMWVLLG